MLAENVLFRAVSKKAENVSRIRFSANSCEQKTKEAPFERGFLLTKAEGCFANSQRLSANRIPLKFAFPGGFEPPTFRLGAVGLSWRLKSVKSRCAALLLGFFEVRISLCTPEIRFFH